MRKGKIAAQCAHASMKVLLDQMDTPEDLSDYMGGEEYLSRTLVYKAGSPLHAWLDGLFGKICVYVNSEEELVSLEEKAKEAGLLNAMIIDEGRTEFHGVKTKTVLAIGPGWISDVDKITGHLPLL
jgi:PTH2 family peptidyl-tRNA hydrolase